MSLDKINYWIYSPGTNAKSWDEFFELGIIGLGWDKIGDLNQYKNREEIKQALDKATGNNKNKPNDVAANDDFLNKMKIGDIVIVKKGRSRLLGYGIITSDYIYDSNRSNFQKIRKVDWKLKGEWKVDIVLVLKTLTDITNFKSKNPNYEKYYEHLLSVMKDEQIQ